MTEAEADAEVERLNKTIGGDESRHSYFYAQQMDDGTWRVQKEEDDRTRGERLLDKLPPTGPLN